MIEVWLDSSGERAYQSPFCQMLVGQGHRVLHSTRHSPIELGKDVISIAPNGELHAFQLKGNPASRLTLQQFRNIEPQLFELVHTAVMDPSAPKRQHRSFLVTNGEVDEEVQTAVHAFNISATRAGKGRKLEIVSRGTLLSWGKELGSALWPSELTDIDQILSLMVTDGRQMLPVERFHALLSAHLRMRSDDKPFSSADDFRRHVTSTALAISLALRAFQQAKNHVAVISGWVLFCTYCIAAAHRFKYSFLRNVLPSLEIGQLTIYESLKDLCSELIERKDFFEGDALTDTLIYRARFTLLVALMAIYWFWSEELGWESECHREFVDRFIPRNFDNHDLWGEGAIPQFLIALWFISERSAGRSADSAIALLARTMVERNQVQETAISPPYFDWEANLRHRLRPILRNKEDPLQGEGYARASYFAEALLHLLVRTNQKAECKAIWPDFTRLGSLQFIPTSSVDYCLTKTENGTFEHRQHRSTQTWVELVEFARDCRLARVPEELSQRSFLLMLFCIICPYRCTTDVVRFLGQKFDSSWFIPPPIT